VRALASAFERGLSCSHSFAPKLVSQDRMQDAIDLLLGMQNSHGGLGTYELIRGSALLEYLNPAEVFGTSVRPSSRAH
jgi:squalene cyclase